MARILVVGDVMLDNYVIGETTRISPEAPVPVVRVLREEFKPGGAANVAANIAAMGCDATLLLLAGPDQATQQLIESLQHYSLKIQIVADRDAETARKSRVVVSQQQIVRVDRDIRPGPVQQQNLLDVFSDILPDFDFVVFSDYAKGTLDRLPEFIDLTKSKRKFTLVDPKRSDPNFYRGVSLLKPNLKEFTDLFGVGVALDSIPKYAQRAMVEYNIGAMVVTLGAQGMIVIDGQEAYIKMQTKAHEVFDVSGAGDTVIAALACELSIGKSLFSAAEISNIAASIAVSHSGTYVVTSQDLKKQIYKETVETKKIILPEILSQIILSLRESNKKIVFTNGCFDILHPGHVRLLKEARLLGDVLIVGLNSDTSVKALKGDQRPINTFASRSEVISGLEAVDYVVEFDAPTPIELIRQIKPDVLVKGGDYKVEEIIGHEIVLKNGGVVRSLKFHVGYSTTKIVNDIARSI